MYKGEIDKSERMGVDKGEKGERSVKRRIWARNRPKKGV
jgi:hypothetical protein